MNGMLSLLYFALCLFVNVMHSYKVLVYSPMIYYSHMNFVNSIADVLAEAGNDVVCNIVGSQKIDYCKWGIARGETETLHFEYYFCIKINAKFWNLNYQFLGVAST